MMHRPDYLKVCHLRAEKVEQRETHRAASQARELLVLQPAWDIVMRRGLCDALTWDTKLRRRTVGGLNVVIVGFSLALKLLSSSS